jgi:ABC-type maltose transport system permease subunit
MAALFQAGSGLPAATRLVGAGLLVEHRAWRIPCILRQFFLSLPRELEEAAILDGANHWQIFTQLVLPRSRPPWPFCHF